MANPTAGFGFQPSRLIGGSSLNAQLVEEKILYSDTAKIHQFSPVTRGVNGYINVSTANDAPVHGVLEGCEFYDSSLNLQIYSPMWTGVSTASSGTVKGLVILATPFQLFKARNSGTVMTIADKGANAKVEVVTGDDLTKLSKFRVDQSTLNTTNTLPFQIWDIYPTQGAFNDATLDNNIVEGLFVNNTVTSTTGKTT